MNLEDRLHASAQRQQQTDNRRLHVPENPRLHRRTYWGWVATPVAAVIGIVVGLSLPLLMQHDDTDNSSALVPGTSSALALVPDTVIITHHDTVYQPQIVERERVVWHTRPASSVVSAHPHASDSDAPITSSAPSEPSTPECTSVQCDGINYSMLSF